MYLETDQYSLIIYSNVDEDELETTELEIIYSLSEEPYHKNNNTVMITMDCSYQIQLNYPTIVFSKNKIDMDDDHNVQLNYPSMVYSKNKIYRDKIKIRSSKRNIFPSR